MKYVTNTIEVWKSEMGTSFVMRVSLGPCPHCLGYECIVDTVEVGGTPPEKYPHAVHCGGCGARGPWADTALGAVQSWNNTLDVCTSQLSYAARNICSSHVMSSHRDGKK